VSSDLTQCVTSCNISEVVVIVDSVQFCRKCLYGLNADNTACKKPTECNPSTELFDLDTGACVDKSACASKLLSVDGLKCGTKCLFPEVTRLGVSTT
jgi:hypothetical protein